VTTTSDYTYDPLDRLIAADYDSGIYFHYAYDPAGNRLESVQKFPSLDLL